jgi:superoxide reductase
MTKLREIYKCNICGNIVEVLHTGAGELVCCNQPMELLEEKTKDEGLEKHVPVLKKSSSGVVVKVGSTSHPMEEKHYIEWIELHTSSNVYRQFLKPNQPPKAVFKVPSSELKSAKAREYCNLHGLWTT